MEVKRKVLELFAGIGGFSLGLERTGGFETIAFCEIDKHARKVLQKNWPSVPIYEDVKEITYERLKADGNVPDVITGGFPCQDISLAGKGAGLAGERSGLWWEFHRIIKEVRPRWVIAENVSALRSRGLDEVLRSLSEIGYDAEWHCIPASAVGAPHQRDRIWIVAYPQNKGADWRVGFQSHYAEKSERWDCHGRGSIVNERHETLAYPNHSGHSTHRCGFDGNRTAIVEEWQIKSFFESGRQGWWATEPPVGRVAHGVLGRTHRLKQLGNAVVPMIPELIGMAIHAHSVNDNEEKSNG